MMSREKLERAITPALLVVAALTLVACAETPRTEFAWGVREHKTVPKVASNAAGNTFYGPRSVTLPPVQKKTLEPVRQASVVPAPKPRKQPAWYTQSNPQPVQQARNDNAAPRVTDSGALRFVWPVSGRIVSDYGTNSGGERNDGINIAAAQGAPVHAAASGTVSYCGNELKGFGNLVLIRHDNGYITAYAHVGSILVNRDDRVLAGQVIATAGATGDVSSPQLHFEIRAGDKRPVDPKSMLPKGVVVASNS
jgi:murein DD-endopeptidase MepM/ murein hydrolase activator NlpD